MDVNTNAWLSQSHTGREDVSGLRLAAGKRPASLLPTSSFPVCSYILYCLSLPSGMCWLPPLNQRKRCWSSVCACLCLCVTTEGHSSVYKMTQKKCSVTKADVFLIFLKSFPTNLYYFKLCCCRLFEGLSRWGKWLENVGMYQQWAEGVSFLFCFLSGSHVFVTLVFWRAWS